MIVEDDRIHESDCGEDTRATVELCMKNALLYRKSTWHGSDDLLGKYDLTNTISRSSLAETTIYACLSHSPLQLNVSLAVVFTYKWFPLSMETLSH